MSSHVRNYLLTAAALLVLGVSATLVTVGNATAQGRSATMVDIVNPLPVPVEGEMMIVGTPFVKLDSVGNTVEVGNDANSPVLIRDVDRTPELTFNLPATDSSGGISPGTSVQLAIPAGHRPVVTDVYAKNRGTGGGCLHVGTSETTDVYCLSQGETLVINYSTGRKMPSAGEIFLANAIGSGAISARIHGKFVPVP